MEKQRKFLMVLPLLIIPFLTMAFWALGGGQGSQPKQAPNQGLDTKLPEAQFNKQDKTDKMAAYQSAQRDSSQNGISPAFLHTLGLDTTKSDVQAERIQTKLAQLNQQLSQPQPPSEEPEQVKHLKKMMQETNTPSAPDPEIQQLNQMLDKIQAIQNPQAVKPETPKAEAALPFRAIPAIIDGKQKVADGAAVQLRLTDSVTIKDQMLTKGQLLFGVCQITNQRLLLNIQNIRLDQQIIPVSLTVFSLDGMPGIPAPEAELGGAATNGADNAIQNMQFLSMDQSLGVQAAASGINAAKGLLNKKVKKIKVKLQDQYPVLLKINK